MQDEPRREVKDFTDPEATTFWQDFRKEVANGHGDFVGWRFPRDPTGTYLKNTTFSGEVDFSDTHWEEGCLFKDATFLNDVFFSHATFNGPVSFIETRFRRCSRFYGTQFRSTSRFHMAHFGLDESSTHFEEARFASNCSFWGGRFFGPCVFQQAVFDDSVDMTGVEFRNDVDFTRATFRGSAVLHAARFSRMAVFGGCVFHEKLDLSFAISHGIFLFDLPSGLLRSCRRPLKSLVWGHDAYRLTKQSALDRGDREIAGHCHYVERSRYCNALIADGFSKLFPPTGNLPPQKTNSSPVARWLRAFPARFRGFARLSLGLLEFAFARLLFGYGERIRGVLVAMLLVVFGWTLKYCQTGLSAGSGAAGRVHGFWECLYFSIVTFTTLGYGDLQPTEGLRIWAASEALIGAFLMALFVVAMARKFTR